MPSHVPISVLMPVYNARKFVAQAIESILGQSFANFEFLILDDGSTDDSLAIIRRYQEQDGRIKVTTRANRGVVRSLNELVEQSSGDFLARMDADDVAMPNRLRLQLDALVADPELVCLGGTFEIMDEKGRLLTELQPPLDDFRIQQDALAGHTSICHPTAMIRRTAMDMVGAYSEDIKTAEDLDLWLRLGEIGKLANLPQTILRYRLHDASVSERAGAEQREDQRKACERAWQRRGITGTFEANEPWRPSKDHASRAKFAMRYGWWAFVSGQRSTALYYATRAVGAAPFNLESWRLLYCAAVKRMKPSSGTQSAGDS